MSRSGAPFPDPGDHAARAGQAELLHQLTLGAKAAGDSDLEAALAAAARALQRGIPFSSSLYI